MMKVLERSRPCPLCGGRGLVPAFDPPIVRCGSCGLVFRNQEAGHEQVRAEFEAVYQSPLEEERVQDRRRLLHEEFLACVRPLPPRNRLLDVGCGRGQFLLLARERGWDVAGMEIAEGAARAARATGLRIHVGSLTTVELPEASVDVVTLWNVLDFMPDPVAELRAASRVLAPGGMLVARVSNLAFQSAVYRASRAFRRWPSLGAALARQRFLSQVSFSARTLRHALERAGFERIEIRNSRPTYGDPYRTLPRGGDRALQAAKRSVHGLAWLMAACSGGRVLWGSSLLARAVKQGESAAPGD